LSNFSISSRSPGLRGGLGYTSAGHTSDFPSQLSFDVAPDLPRVPESSWSDTIPSEHIPIRRLYLGDDDEFATMLKADVDTTRPAFR
jgi:hypothetical protein